MENISENEEIVTETDENEEIIPSTDELPPVADDANATQSDAEDTPVDPTDALIALGLSEREARLVIRDREERSGVRRQSDALPRTSHTQRLNISYGELLEMREIFSELSDTEINRLYNKVTK